VVVSRRQCLAPRYMKEILKWDPGYFLDIAACHLLQWRCASASFIPREQESGRTREQASFRRQVCGGSGQATKLGVEFSALKLASSPDSGFSQRCSFQLMSITQSLRLRVDLRTRLCVTGLGPGAKGLIASATGARQQGPTIRITGCVWGAIETPSGFRRLGRGERPGLVCGRK